MKFRGEILAEHALAIIFRVGDRKVKLPKAGIRRLEPNDYRPGPHTVYLPGWLAHRLFGRRAQQPAETI